MAHEISNTPLTGFKIALPMISARGDRTAFTGVAVGRKHVYMAAATALCLNDARHAVPHAVCKCGFYCLHTFDAARDLTCLPQNREAVVLEVGISGRYRRYEQGLRYEHQRVKKVWTGRCRCGRAAEVFTDSDEGCTGWRQLTPSCVRCADSRPLLTLSKFAVLTDQDGLSAEVDRPQLSNFVTTIESPGDIGQFARGPLIDAELAVLNARINELQRQVDRLDRGQDSWPRDDGHDEA